MNVFPIRIVLSMVAVALATVGAGTTPTTSAQDTLWTATYGGVEDDYGFDVAPTSDGGFILTGETYSRPLAGLSDVWLVKTDVVQTIRFRYRR